MLDNVLYATLISIIETAEPAYGMPLTDLGDPGVPVYQSYQVTQQGVPTGPCAFLTIVSHHRYGFQHRSDVYDPINSVMNHVVSQQYETRFQLDALATQNVKLVDQYTASDIINLIAAILQSDQTVAQLQALGMGIERIQEVRNPKFIDDRGRFEASPSLDFIVTHRQIITTTIPVITSTELDIIEV